MLFLKQYYLECLSHASYLVGDRTSGRAVVVDPQRDIQQYVEEARSVGLTIERIIHTHVHADFVSGQLELAQATGAPISYGRTDKNIFEFPVEFLDHRQALSLGEVELTILATPGHTAESICIHITEQGSEFPGAVLTGDTLFIGDVGRPDLVAGAGSAPEDMAEQLYRSLHEQLLTLPDETMVYPAHGAGSSCGKHLSEETVSTIGVQRSTNYALQKMSCEAFVATVLAGQSQPPDYFSFAVQTNRQARPVAQTGEAPVVDRSAAEAFEHSGGTLLDIRSADEFAAGHLKHSINVGLNGRFAEQVGQVIAPRSAIVLVANPGDEQEALVRLSRIGFDLVKAVHHIDAKSAPCTSKRLTPEAVFELLPRIQEGHIQLLDVRTNAEASLGVLPGAQHFPLAQLKHQAIKLSPDSPIIVYCAGGYRSSVAASLLRRLGLNVMGDLSGGINSWLSSGLPSEHPIWMSTSASLPFQPTGKKTCSR